MSTIRFSTKLAKINDWTILVLPKQAGEKLPTRGMSVVEGTMNTVGFQAVLEPDGQGSHWFNVDAHLRKAAGVEAGSTVMLEIEPSEQWPEPVVPQDFESALAADPGAWAKWGAVTTAARWDWIRWIRSAKHQQTRRRRIEAACDKLKKGERRPCCFNRNLCTEPSVSHNGVLLVPREPTHTEYSEVRSSRRERSGSGQTPRRVG